MIKAYKFRYIFLNEERLRFLVGSTATVKVLETAPASGSTTTLLCEDTDEQKLVDVMRDMGWEQVDTEAGEYSER